MGYQRAGKRMAGKYSVKWCVPCYIIIVVVNLWANIYVNEVMDASCEPLDLILLPGMRPLASNLFTLSSIHAIRSRL